MSIIENLCCSCHDGAVVRCKSTDHNYEQCSNHMCKKHIKTDGDGRRVCIPCAKAEERSLRWTRAQASS